MADPNDVSAKVPGTPPYLVLAAVLVGIGFYVFNRWDHRTYDPVSEARMILERIR